MQNILRSSGIPLKISLISVPVFILGISYIIFFSIKNFNGELDDRIEANAKSLSTLVGKEFLLNRKHPGIDMEATMRNALQTDPFIEKIAVIDAFNGSYIHSTEHTDRNRAVGAKLLEVMKSGERDAMNRNVFSYENGEKQNEALQFSAKIIDLDAPINPVAFTQILYDHERINGKKRDYFNNFLIVSVAVVALCFLLMFLLLSKVSVTIQKIRIAIDGLAKNVYVYELPERGDELGQLIQSLETLKSHIKSLNSKLRLFEQDSKQPRGSAEVQDATLRAAHEKNGVFAKISVEPLHLLLANRNQRQAMQTCGEVLDFLGNHFSQACGSVIFFDGSSALIHFQGAEKEKNALESLIQLQKRIQTFSPEIKADKNVKLTVRGALHRGDLFFSEGGQGFQAYLGSLRNELNLIFEHASEDEILASSAIPQAAEAKYGSAKKKEKIPLDGRPDLELYSLIPFTGASTASAPIPHSDKSPSAEKSRFSPIKPETPAFDPSKDYEEEDNPTSGISAMVDEVFSQRPPI